MTQYVPWLLIIITVVACHVVIMTADRQLTDQQRLGMKIKLLTHLTCLFGAPLCCNNTLHSSTMRGLLRLEAHQKFCVKLGILFYLHSLAVLGAWSEYKNLHRYLSN